LAAIGLIWDLHEVPRSVREQELRPGGRSLALSNATRDDEARSSQSRKKETDSDEPSNVLADAI
jgi:hypothetical protein